MPQIRERNDVTELLTGAVTPTSGVTKDWGGGPGILFVSGTFGGATVSLQVMGPKGDLWFDVGPECTKTAPGIGGFDLPAGNIRAVVSGGAGADVHADVRPLGTRRGL